MKRWPTKKLGELLKIQNGFAFKSELFNDDSKGLPIIRIRDLERGFSETFYNGEHDRAFEVENGDFLIGMDGEFRCYRWAGDKALLNQRVCRLQNFSNNLSAGYVFYGINAHLREIEDNTSFVTVKHLSSKQIADIGMPVPPLAEQERIVKLLDEADELRQLRAQADHRTGQLLPALFHQMFGGSKFKPVRIGELTSLVTSGSTPRGGNEVYVSEGPYFIRSQNVRMNQFDLSDAVCLPAEVHEQMARTKVAKGDVLLNITGASIGRVAWVEKLDREANVSQHVCLIRPKPELLSAVYLSVFISLPATQYFILQIQAGASRQALNHQQVRALEIPVPSLPLQKEFAQQVTEIRALEATQATSRQRTEDLFQSLLHRAFNGEL